MDRDRREHGVGERKGGLRGKTRKGARQVRVGRVRVLENFRSPPHCYYYYSDLRHYSPALVDYFEMIYACAVLVF